VDDQTDETVLELIAESLEFLEVRDARRDFRTTAWNYTFTTSMQEQDNPADFRWRCIHSDNPTASRFTPPDCRALSAVRATKWTGEETAFARTGRQGPRFVAEPQDARITEGEAARFTAKAEGVPNPTYQWFSVDRANNGQVLPGEANPELVVSNPALGISRYVVNVTNSVGNAQSRVATLSVEPKLKLAQVRADTGSRDPAKSVLYNVKSGDDIERQRKRLEAERAQEIFQKRLRRNKILVTVLTITLIAGAGVFVWKKFASEKPPEAPPVVSNDKKERDKNSSAQQPPVTVPPIDQSVRANLPPPTSFPLPTGWTQKAIGSVASTNAEFFPTTNAFDLSAGAEGFSTDGDNILFVCKTNEGDEFKATLKTIRHGDSPSRECGIMLRESDKPKSPFLFIGASPQSVVICYRNYEGQLSTNSQSKGSNTNVPVYLKLSHQEKNQFVPAYSFDNTNWYPTNTPLQASVIFTNSPMLVGFAVCSGSFSNSVQVLLLHDVFLQTTR
jgi:hypothetical protein